MNIKAMKSALEALKRLNDIDGVYSWASTEQALRQAIADAEKQAATIEDNSQDWATLDGAAAWHLIERHADNWADIGKMMDEFVAAKLAKHKQAIQESTLQEISDIGQEIEQEPVPVGMTCKVWTHGCALFDGIDLPNETLLYTAPPKRPVKSYTNGEPQYATDAPKREWVGLTMQDIDDVTGDVGFGYIDVSFAIEAKLKGLNNG
jgi:hypothetical protein